MYIIKRSLSVYQEVLMRIFRIFWFNTCYVLFLLPTLLISNFSPRICLCTCLILLCIEAIHLVKVAGCQGRRGYGLATVCHEAHWGVSHSARVPAWETALSHSWQRNDPDTHWHQNQMAQGSASAVCHFWRTGFAFHLPHPRIGHT